MYFCIKKLEIILVIFSEAFTYVDETFFLSFLLSLIYGMVEKVLFGSPIFEIENLMDIKVLKFPEF